MSHLDNLIGSQLSLISQADVRYDGVLFSINAQESSIVLQKVRCLGTEDRVSDPSKKVAANDTLLPFVTFPGHEIKDLYVHDVTAEPATNLPTPPAAAAAAASSGPPAPPAQQKPKPAAAAPPAPAPASAVSAAAPAARAPPSAVGTGEHLMRLRLKKTEDGTRDESNKGEFDFQAGLSHFNKNEVLASVASESAATKEPTKYVKDDFFDNLSCDVLDRAEGRATRLNTQEERALNADTFGAIAVQSNFRRGYRGGRGGGRGGYNQNGGGRGRGNYNNGGSYRGGRGRGRGAGQA